MPLKDSARAAALSATPGAVAHTASLVGEVYPTGYTGTVVGDMHAVMRVTNQRARCRR